MSVSTAIHVVPVPTGVDRLGLPSFQPLPGGVPHPPAGWFEAGELGTVRTLNARANANPQARAFTEYLAEHGSLDIWLEFARQYRRAAGPVRGWIGTGAMLAGMGAATVRTAVAKLAHRRPRPNEIDPTIRTIGPRPRSASYPSGHTSAAYAAATVLGSLWPFRANEFAWWARQTGLSRVHAGVHFPSDVQAGAQVGVRAGLAAAAALR